MNIDTLSYSSVIKAFESVGFHSDSCLSQRQYETCLDKLVKRRYPSQSFDSQVSSELFEQNQKGIDNTVRVSSYAMTVVTAFQILVQRIVQQTLNIEKSGGAGTATRLAEVLREARRDSEILLMAFGEKNTQMDTLQLPQVDISGLLRSSAVTSFDTRSIIQESPIKSSVQAPIVQVPLQTILQTESPYSSQMQLLLILTGCMALIQLIMSHHKYHFVNLPAAIVTFTAVASKFQNKAVFKALQFCMSVAAVLSIYWLVEVAVSPHVHIVFGTDVYHQEVPKVTHEQHTPPRYAQQAMVCIQQMDGRCTMVPQQPVLLDPVPQQAHYIDKSVAPSSGGYWNFAIELLLFLVADALKIVTCIMIFGTDSRNTPLPMVRPKII